MDPVYGWDPGGVDCINNSPPAIGNLALNSDELSDGNGWFYTIHFAWADPGVSGASDPPNLLGGHFSSEVFQREFAEDIELTAERLESGCSTPPTGAEGEIDICSLAHPGTAGCGTGGVEGCTNATFTISYVGSPPLEEGEVIDTEFRIRDLCGATSNEMSIVYTLGSGLLVE